METGNKVVEPTDCSENLSLITYCTCTQNKTVLEQSHIEQLFLIIIRVKFKTISFHVPVLDDALLLNSLAHLHSASRL